MIRWRSPGGLDAPLREGVITASCRRFGGRVLPIARSLRGARGTCLARPLPHSVHASTQRGTARRRRAQRRPSPGRTGRVRRTPVVGSYPPREGAIRHETRGCSETRQERPLATTPPSVPERGIVPEGWTGGRPISHPAEPPPPQARQMSEPKTV